MPRWIPRALRALLVSIALPAAVAAQPPAPTTPPPAETLPPAAAAPTAPAPAPVGGVVAPHAAVHVDPYHVATPYNPTVVNQNIPNPGFNRPFTTLPCIWPNQNLDAYVPAERDCKMRGGKGGCDAGCGGLGKGLKGGHGCAGSCSKGGSCTTCCNASNFALASSRSFFGESSREFFERSPATDGIKMKPVKYSPPPAPAAYVPAYVIVPTP